MKKKTKKVARTSKSKDMPFSMESNTMRLGVPVVTGAAAWVLSGTLVLGLATAAAVGVATHWNKINPSKKRK